MINRFYRIICNVKLLAIYSIAIFKLIVHFIRVSSSFEKQYLPTVVKYFETLRPQDALIKDHQSLSITCWRAYTRAVFCRNTRKSRFNERSSVF